MKTTFQALQSGFKRKGKSGWFFEFGEGYELWFEPLLFDGQMYVALYKDESLLTDKVVVKAGYINKKEKEFIKLIREIVNKNCQNDES